MRAVRVRVADALHDGELPAFEQLREAGQRRVEADAVVDLRDGLCVEAQLRAVLAVVVVGVGGDGVQAVVAAVELQDDEDAAVGVALRLGGQGVGRAGEEGRHGGAAGQQGKVPRPRRRKSRRVVCMRGLRYRLAAALAYRRETTTRARRRMRYAS